MAKTIDMSSMNGPLNDIAGRKTHQLAVTRDYISQPRISKTSKLHEDNGIQVSNMCIRVMQVLLCRSISTVYY